MNLRGATSVVDDNFEPDPSFDPITSRWFEIGDNVEADDRSTRVESAPLRRPTGPLRLRARLPERVVRLDGDRARRSLADGRFLLFHRPARYA